MFVILCTIFNVLVAIYNVWNYFYLKKRLHVAIQTYKKEGVKPKNEEEITTSKDVELTEAQKDGKKRWEAVLNIHNSFSNYIKNTPPYCTPLTHIGYIPEFKLSIKSQEHESFDRPLFPYLKNFEYSKNLMGRISEENKKDLEENNLFLHLVKLKKAARQGYYEIEFSEDEISREREK